MTHCVKLPLKGVRGLKKNNDMTENDKHLIRAALLVSKEHLEIIDDLILEADTEECKYRLKNIRNSL